MDQKSITQKKMDALGTKHIHTIRLAAIRTKIWVIDILSVAVPTFFFVALAISEHGNLYRFLHALELIGAGCLLVGGVAKILGGWEEKIRGHSDGISQNLAVKDQAEVLLLTPNVDAHSSERFRSLTARVEDFDTKMLANVSKKERQSGYRQAIREIDPTNPKVRCPVCGADPRVFVPGSCAECGNSPDRSS